MRSRIELGILLVIALVLLACAKHPQPANGQSDAASSPGEKPGLKIASAAFKDGQPIPRQYTCDGVNVSPPLEWSGMPANAKTVAIVCDDPDAPNGVWVHWVLYNLPADNIGIVENMPTTEKLLAGGFQGTNDFKQIGYGGPCPPSGTHRYFFKIYAVDGELALPAGVTKAELEKAMAGHVVGQTQLMGTYRR